MFFYSLLLGTGLLMSAPWWGTRMLTTRRYREGLPERLGRVPARVAEAVVDRKVVWLHAVSVGEVLAAAGLVAELESTLNAGVPAGGALWRVVISTTTQTGQKLARERFGAERVFWFPLDFGWAVRAWMRALRPRMVVLMESELWPRLLAECSGQGIPVAVVNARLSDRSFRRALRAGRLWQGVLRRVSLFLAQGEETAQRLRQLGVTPERVEVPGNLKYDPVPRDTEMTALLRRVLERSVVVVAGSLLPGEDDVLLGHWAAVVGRVPPAVLVLAPRHPQRFETAAKQVSAQGLALYRGTTLREQFRAKPSTERLKPGAVLLLDTVGDLASVYGLADVAFVGGSLVRKGGHNPLEPARFGVPVLVGPHTDNFREVVAEMEAVRGIQVVHGGEELERSLLHLLTNRVEADTLGQRGLQVFERRSGATQRSVRALVHVLGGSRNVEDKVAL